VKSNEIYRRITVEYRSNCISQRKFYIWREEFKGGQTNVDDALSGEPLIV
jgi:hypothetical protein